jgi:hypothetical protein
MAKTARAPEHQVTIPNTILINNDLSNGEKLILGEIIWLQNYNERKTGELFCYPSNFYLQSVFGYKSERAVIKIISSLAEKEYIRILKNPHGSYRRIRYDFNKCFERDIILGLVKPK